MLTKIFTSFFICCFVSTFAQTPTPTLSIDMRRKLNGYQANYARPANASTAITLELSEKSTALTESNNPIYTSIFTRISNAQNIFGNLCQNSNKLNYNKWVNAVVYVQRKSPTYNASINSNDGAIVAYVGKNRGSSWDSTCLWTNATQWANNPQVALYNPPGNSNLANAHVVATGPVKTGTTITGSFYASKLVGATGNNMPGADMQYFSNTGVFSSTTSPNMTKHDLPQFGLTQTHNGVYSIGMLYNDVNATTDANKGIRGAHISKGIFNSGMFVWTSDSIIPPIQLKTDGTKQMWNEPLMTWNESGHIGYVVFIGLRLGITPTSRNHGWQPLIYKTTNGGNSWNLMNGIDFGDAQYDHIINSLSPTQTNNTVTIPFLNPLEGIDLTVDLDGHLHLFSTVLGTAKTHVDSVTYVNQYTVGGEQYGWAHKNNMRPYLIDFMGDGNTFTHKIIDSVGTECPGTNSLLPGFNNNPWADADSTKSVASGMRLQVANSSEADVIAYSWAESDTTLTTNLLKWNEFPNIKTKVLRVCDNAVSVERYVITDPPSGFNPNVRDKAYFHYMSPTVISCHLSNTTAGSSIPFIVSNNSSTEANLPVNNYYACSEAVYTLPGGCSWWGPPPPLNNCGFVNINENKNNITSFNLFPNPANSSVETVLTLNSNEPINIQVYNTIGALMSSDIKQGKTGENKLMFDLANYAPGVYFVKVKTTYSESTKKLIIQ